MKAPVPSRSVASGSYSGLDLGLRLLGIGPALILIALIIVLSFLSPVFLTPRNVSNILAQTAVITVVAMGQHLVILTRGIDLSVGSNLALASVVGALLFQAGGSATADGANAELLAGLRVSPEGQEGISAFLDKRKPAWCA